MNQNQFEIGLRIAYFKKNIVTINSPTNCPHVET